MSDDSPSVIKAGEHVLACAHIGDTEYRAWAWFGDKKVFRYTVGDSGEVGHVDTQWMVMCLDCNAKYSEMTDTDNILVLVEKIIQIPNDHKLASAVKA